MTAEDPRLDRCHLRFRAIGLARAMMLPVLSVVVLWATSLAGCRSHQQLEPEPEELQKVEVIPGHPLVEPSANVEHYPYRGTTASRPKTWPVQDESRILEILSMPGLSREDIALEIDRYLQLFRFSPVAVVFEDGRVTRVYSGGFISRDWMPNGAEYGL